MIALFKKQAFEAKKQADHYGPSVDNYDTGLLMGYAHILDVFKNRTFVLWIDRKEIGLDIEPEVDLLGFTRNPMMERIDNAGFAIWFRSEHIHPFHYQS